MANEFNPARAIAVEDQPPAFDPNRAIAVEDPEQSVFFEDRSQVVGFPAGLDQTEMEYSVKTDIDKKSKNDFMGMVEYSKDLAGNLGKGLANFALSFPSTIGSIVKEAGETELQKRQREDDRARIAEKLILDPGELVGFLSRRVSEGLAIPERIAAAGQKVIDANQRFLQKTGIKAPEEAGPQRVAFDLGNAAGSITSSIGLTFLTKKPILVAPLFGIIQKAQIYEEARAKGISPEEASITSTAAGTAEAALEFVGLHVFFDMIKVSKPIAKIALRTATEAVQEGSQQGAEESIAKIAGIRNDTMVDISKRIAYATALGLVGGFPGSVVFTIVERQGVIKDLKAQGLSDEEARKVVENISNKQVKSGLEDQVAKVIEKETSPLNLSEAEQAENFKKFNELVQQVTGQMKTSPEGTQALEAGIKAEGQENIVLAVRQGDIDQSGAYFATAGSSTYFDLENKAAKKYDISAAKIAKSGTPEMRQILEKAKTLKNSPEEIARIDEALTAMQDEDNHVDYLLFDEVTSIKEAAEQLGFDGVKVWENDDIADPSSVFIWNTEKIKPLEEEPIDVDFYAQNIEKARMKFDVAETFEDTGEAFSKLLAPVSTQLKIINPQLKYRLRKFEFDVRRKIQADEKVAEPLLRKMKKLPEEDKAILDLALKNGDTKKTGEILSKNNMTDEFENVRMTLDDVYQRANAVGLDVNYIVDYFPRRVKDYKGLVEYFSGTEYAGDILAAITAKEVELGRPLELEEQAELINTLIRGYGSNQIKLTRPGNVKIREIPVIDKEINQFYFDSSTALVTYITTVNDAIESRKFFGKSSKQTKFENIEDSIGAYVLGLIQDQAIKPADQTQVSALLKARFMQRGTHGFWSAFKNISYMQTMGSPISAITQVQDLAFSLYKSGYYQTVKAVKHAIFKESKIKKEDIGIEDIAAEFTDNSKSSKALKKVFDIIGFTWMDRFGKETTVNSVLDKLVAQAKAGTIDATFNQKLQDMFGEQAGQVIEDLKSDVLSENVRLMAFNELADVQPIALSEMPPTYLTSGNGRVFYMLKTYTIKLIDVYRNEVFLQLDDRPIEALGNLFRLTTALMMMGMGADTLKDLILWRPIKLNDLVVDNIMKLMGFSKYTIYKARYEGPTKAAMEAVLPPSVSLVDASFKDVAQHIKAAQSNKKRPEHLEVVQYIPLVGKLYYWWFGKGREKSIKKAGKAVRK